MHAMAHKHEEQAPAALETLIARLGDLEVVLGVEVRPALGDIQTRLIAARAARDRGDVPAAVAQIGEAMDRLSRLADQFEPAEAVLMRAMAQSFRAALLRGDEAAAKERAAAMLQKSGAIERGKS
jgi:hypothetical protein